MLDDETKSLPERIDDGGGRCRRRRVLRVAAADRWKLRHQPEAPSWWIRSHCSNCRRISTCSSWNRWAQPMVPSKRPGIMRAIEWREDVVEVTRELAPTMMRWGGIFADFYRWREGVGPRDKRPSMLNLLWGGIESNQVGTGEFVELCRHVGAQPLICVNFESDGRKQYMKVEETACARPTRRKRPSGWRIATIRTIATGRVTGTRRRGRPALADRERDVLRQEWLRSRNRGAQDRRVCQGHACGRSRDSTDRVGRQRLGGAHGGGGGRTCPVPRVPSHVRSRFAAEAGAAGRAVSARPGCDLGAADGGVAADRRQDSHRSRQSGRAERFRLR